MMSDELGTDVKVAQTCSLGLRLFNFRTADLEKQVRATCSGAVEKSDSSRPGSRRRGSQSSEPDQASGTFQGTVEVKKTTQQEMEGAVNFTDAVLTVWDSRSGQKLHETRHRGKLRWSKPQKDCLEDALKFLHGESK